FIILLPLRLIVGRSAFTYFIKRPDPRRKLMSTDRKRVMLLIESSRAYGRGCLLGVAAYVRSHGRWSVLHIERGLTENVPKFLRSWKGDGVVARIENEKIAKAVADFGVPAVDLRGSPRPVNGAMLDTDPRIVTRMAAEHFL